MTPQRTRKVGLRTNAIHLCVGSAIVLNIWGKLTLIGAMMREAKPTWPIPSGAKWELINGYPITYRDEGQGTPIVFIHGAVTDYRAFAPQFVALASSYA